jgi:hypothetical protein
VIVLFAWTMGALAILMWALLLFVALHWGDDEHCEHESDRRWRR